MTTNPKLRYIVAEWPTDHPEEVKQLAIFNHRQDAVNCAEEVVKIHQQHPYREAKTVVVFEAEIVETVQ